MSVRTVTFIFLFLFFIHTTTANWLTFKTSFVLLAQTTKFYSFSSSVLFINFNVNCSEPCSVNLVNNTEISKIQNNQSYVSLYSELTRESYFSFSETKYLQKGISLVIKNTQPTDSMNTWVQYQEFVIPNSGLSTAEQVYVVLGVFSGMIVLGFIICVCGSLGCFLYIKLKPSQINKNDW
jgi:hypothetical protein